MLSLLFILIEVQSYITLPIESIQTFSFRPLNNSMTLNQSLSMSAAVTNYIDHQYIVSIELGTPGQKLSLILDTDSSWIWVPGKTCNCHKTKKSFNPSASSTYKSKSIIESFEYKYTPIDGYRSLETIQIDKKKATNQTFVLIHKESNLGYLQSDGIFGLANYVHYYGGPSSIIQTLYDQKVIKKQIFSLYFNNVNDKYKIPSAFTIGGYDATLYGQGSAKVVKTLTSGYWDVKIEKVAIGTFSQTRSINGIFDSGTSTIQGPASDVASIKKIINSKVSSCNNKENLLNCPCKLGDYDNWPNLVFIIDDKGFIIHPKNYIYYNSNTCYVMINNNDKDFWRLGVPFFLAYYSVFDLETKKIILYKAAYKQETLGSPNEFYLLGILACGVFALGIGGFYYRKLRKVEETSYTRIV